MKLEEVLKKLRTQTYYAILGVNNTVATNALRVARRKLLSEYHPDKHDDDKELATQISSYVNEAFEALSDEEFREKYDSSGCTIAYRTTANIVKKTEIKQSDKSRDQAITLTAFGEATLEVLQNGGTIEVMPLPIGGISYKEKPVKIEVPAFTSSGSMLVVKGLGQEHESDSSLNGDLIVIITCVEPIPKEMKNLLSPKSSYTLIEGKYKNDIITLPKPLSDIKFTKEGEKPSLVLIESVMETNNGLLIKV